MILFSTLSNLGPPQVNFQIGSFLILHAYFLFLPLIVSKLLLFLILIVIISIWLYFIFIPHSSINTFEELTNRVRK